VDALNPYWTIAEAGRGLRQGHVSARLLTELCLQRISSIDPRLHSFITVTANQALASADVLDAELARGVDRGPLHGIPVALKDSFATNGIRTTCHSGLFEDWVPDFDAGVVERLHAAGAIILGKLSMHELAFGGPTTDAPFPAARNPWNEMLVPGGSSSGAGVALAAGLCFGAIGSDSGGSARHPAAHCGVVGFKGTFGRVNRYGLVPLSPSLDHVGPMARSAEDCRTLFAAIAGHDPRDPASVRQPPAARRGRTRMDRLRIGVPRAGWFDQGLGIQEDVAAAFGGALATLGKMGATIVEVDGEPFALAAKANKLVLVAEAYEAYRAPILAEPSRLGSSFRTRVLAGAFLSAADYLTAQRAAIALSARIRRVFRDVDVLVTPTFATPPEPFGPPPAAFDLRPRFTGAFNTAGLPAISTPCGFTDAGLPIGLQIAADSFRDDLVLEAAILFEAATPWHRRHPPLG
jgi:aspartyl-tRNA(Asn)/glutamyl-tRNA(Gln) amidotransferase subunit A